jgi:hypothetical protein
MVQVWTRTLNLLLNIVTRVKIPCVCMSPTHARAPHAGSQVHRYELLQLLLKSLQQLGFFASCCPRGLVVIDWIWKCCERLWPIKWPFKFCNCEVSWDCCLWVVCSMSSMNDLCKRLDKTEKLQAKTLMKLLEMTISKCHQDFWYSTI